MAQKPKTNYQGAMHPKDMCYTPPYAVDPIRPYLKKEWNVWEHAAGKMHIARALGPHVNRVYCTDYAMDPKFDFLSDYDLGPESPYDIMITNPPFSLKYKWLKRAYERALAGCGRFALLMPVDVVGASHAQVLFERHGIEIIFVRPRIDYRMPNQGWRGGGAQFGSAWYTFGLNIGMQMSYATVKKWSAERLEAFDRELERETVAIQA